MCPRTTCAPISETTSLSWRHSKFMVVQPCEDDKTHCRTPCTQTAGRIPKRVHPCVWSTHAEKQDRSSLRGPEPRWQPPLEPPEPSIVAWVPLALLVDDFMHAQIRQKEYGDNYYYEAVAYSWLNRYAYTHAHIMFSEVKIDFRQSSLLSVFNQSSHSYYYGYDQRVQTFSTKLERDRNQLVKMTIICLLTIFEKNRYTHWDFDASMWRWQWQWHIRMRSPHGVNLALRTWTWRSWPQQKRICCIGERSCTTRRWRDQYLLTDR